MVPCSMRILSFRWVVEEDVVVVEDMGVDVSVEAVFGVLDMVKARIVEVAGCRLGRIELQ